MDKINHLNYFSNLDPRVKKEKSKKSDKSKSKKTFYKEKVSLFEEIFNAGEIPSELDQIDKQEQRLENLLKEIGNQGEKLKKSRLLEDLDIYKKLVKEYIYIFIFLSEEIEKKALWDSKKKEKISKVHIKIINQELLELTKIFFSEQQNTFAIAAKIDRIEGILVDMKR